MGDIDVRFYLSLILRRLPVVLAIVVAVSAGGVALAYLLPAVYQASARILVEAPEIPAELARSTVPTSAEDQMQVIRQQIDTRENLIGLADKLDVYGDKRAAMTPDDVVDDMRARMTFERLILDGKENSGATVYSLSYNSKNPDLAAKVVNEIVDLILTKNVRQRTDSAGQTLKFFTQEVSRLGTELGQIEAQILKFKNANKDALPDSLDFRRSQQSSMQERLLLLEREEAGLRTRRTNLVQMQETTGQMVGTGPVTLEQQMLQDLNKALSEQLAIFSETSPSIVSLRARIAALQESIRSRNDPNVVAKRKGMSDLDFQLSDIDERLKFITSEKASLSDTIAQLTKTIADTPSTTTTLNAMDRNRTNIQTQYNTAVARLAEASTGEQIEIRSKGGRFSLVEPATAPEYPVLPKRKRIAGLGILAGIGLALGFVVLMEVLNKTVRRPADIEALFQTQPLATIPYIWAEGEPGAQKAKRNVFASLKAGAAPVALIAIALGSIGLPDRRPEPPSTSPALERPAA